MTPDNQNGPDHLDDIAAIFRAGELERRRARQNALLQNEAALGVEHLSEKDKQAHLEAAAAIRAQREMYKEAVEANLDKADKWLRWLIWAGAAAVVLSLFNLGILVWRVFHAV